MNDFLNLLERGITGRAGYCTNTAVCLFVCLFVVVCFYHIGPTTAKIRMPSSSLSVLSIPSSRWRLKWGRRVAVTTAAAFVTLFLVLNVWNVLYQVSSRDLDDCELVLRGVILPSTSTFTSKSTLILDSNPNVEGDDTDADADADADPLFIADPHHNAFAACLMIADDNQRLGEWLPYQYFAMPLRHLVVLVDGASTVSPTRILDKWRPYMTIEEWNEGHLNRTDVLTDRAEPQYKNLVRKNRQGYFYRKCATHLKALNYTWTSFIDTDEYPVLNDDHVPLAAQLMSTPGVILKTIQDVQQKIKAKTIDSHEQYAGPCVVTYRQEYGHVESTASEIARDVPTAVVDNPLRFDTLRYRHRARLLIGKSFYDLTHFLPQGNGTRAYFHHRGDMGTHRILPACPDPWPRPGHWLRINHYVGSWESYNARQNDTRVRPREQWEHKGNISMGVDDTIRPWIGAFVRHMGMERSRHLLADAGNFDFSKDWIGLAKSQ
uniref:Glycosyltransferase family 92 protein n=1 Tax=Amphora coffeiformis TaxID=265554 RepID=A0A7S3L5Z0_9STRA